MWAMRYGSTTERWHKAKDIRWTRSGQKDVETECGQEIFDAQLVSDSLPDGALPCGRCSGVKSKGGRPRGVRETKPRNRAHSRA